MNDTKERNLQKLLDVLAAQDAELAAKDAELAANRAELAAKDAELRIYAPVCQARASHPCEWRVMRENTASLRSVIAFVVFALSSRWRQQFCCAALRDFQIHVCVAVPLSLVLRADARSD